MWNSGYRLKAVLHCNFSCNLCRNSSALLQLHEQRCYGCNVSHKSQEGCYTAMLQKSVVSLRKVELDSTSCNACYNKNVARLGDCGVCYTMQFLVQLVSQQNCKTSCTKNCSVTPPLICIHHMQSFK